MPAVLSTLRQPALPPPPARAQIQLWMYTQDSKDLYSGSVAQVLQLLQAWLPRRLCDNQRRRALVHKLVVKGSDFPRKIAAGHKWTKDEVKQALTTESDTWLEAAKWPAESNALNQEAYYLIATLEDLHGLILSPSAQPTNSFEVWKSVVTALPAYGESAIDDMTLEKLQDTEIDRELKLLEDYCNIMCSFFKNHPGATRKDRKRAERWERALKETNDGRKLGLRKQRYRSHGT